MTDTGSVPRTKRSLGQLLADLPRQLVELAKAELAQLQQEMVGKLKAAGIGVGMFVVAAVLAFLALCVFIAAAILGIAVALPAWLSALIVGAALLIFAVILFLVGRASLKKSMPPMPEKTISGVKDDIDAIRGMGHYDN